MYTLGEKRFPLGLKITVVLLVYDGSVRERLLDCRKWGNEKERRERETEIA